MSIVSTLPATGQVAPSLPVKAPLRHLTARECGMGWDLVFDSASQPGTHHTVHVVLAEFERPCTTLCDCPAGRHLRPCWHVKDAEWLAERAAAVLAELASLTVSRMEPAGAEATRYREGVYRRLTYLRRDIEDRGYDLGHVWDYKGGQQR